MVVSQSEACLQMPLHQQQRYFKSIESSHEAAKITEPITYAVQKSPSNFTQKEGQKERLMEDLRIQVSERESDIIKLSMLL